MTKEPLQVTLPHEKESELLLIQELERRAIYKKVKHSTTTVVHYTITTNQGLKRYVSCLLSMELRKCEEERTVEIKPFVFCLV